MRKYFSKRHEKSLAEGKLKPAFSRKLRTSMRRVLDNHTQYNDFDGDDTYSYAENTLKIFYGEDTLQAYDDSDKLVPARLEDVILRGYPPKVIDAIEAWCDHSPTDIRCNCERELNDILEIHSSPWRIVSSTFFLIDSEYVREAMVVKIQELLCENSIQGALEEFSEAVMKLTEGENKNAVIAAHKSVESVMKTALGIQEHVTFGELLARLVKSGIIPKYYEEFLIHFEKMALAAVKERNRPGGGHGQGTNQIELPRSLTEFTIHLAAALNIFIVKRWLEYKADNP